MPLTPSISEDLIAMLNKAAPQKVHLLTVYMCTCILYTCTSMHDIIYTCISTILINY